MINTEITTDKQAFEFVKNHLLMQNAKSYCVPSGSCGYRGYSVKEIKRGMQETFGKEFYFVYHWPEIDTLSSEQVNQLDEASENMIPDLRCAVGCLIDDSFYETSFEDNSVTLSSILNAVKDSNPNWRVSDRSVEMLKKVQRIHDMHEPEDWITYLSLFEFDDFDNYRYFNENSVVYED